MFKFLFGKTGATVKIETQRDTISRALDEVNGVLALMADKPAIGIDLNSGRITVELPDQMPDEALALPAPENVSTDKENDPAADEKQQTAA